MASLYPKKIGGKTWWYLREMARVDGKPKMVAERYLGTAAEIAAAVQAKEAAMLPERTRHLAFGDVAAVWGMLQKLGVAAIVDEVMRARPGGLPLPAGTYLALAALNRGGAPCSKLALAHLWETTAADRVTQNRAALRLVGLGLVVTRDGGIPRTWHASPGDRPDVTQFAAMIGQLRRQYEAIAAAIPGAAAGSGADMTVVFDAGQNSEDNFAHLAGTGLHYIGSLPAPDFPDLTALPPSARAVGHPHRFAAPS